MRDGVEARLEQSGKASWRSPRLVTMAEEFQAGNRQCKGVQGGGARSGCGVPQGRPGQLGRESETR